MDDTTTTQVGTCTNNVCSYGSTCTVNSDCSGSMSCVMTDGVGTCAIGCTAGDPSATPATVDTCMNGTFANGDTALKAVCVSNVCTYDSACSADTECAQTGACDTTNSVCLASCSSNTVCTTANL